MMHEIFKMRRNGKTAEFAAATVTDDHGGHPPIKQPIDSRKNRQAQAEGEWDKTDPNQHDQTTRGLIEIFLRIELIALTNRAGIKYRLYCSYGPLRFLTKRTNQRRTGLGIQLAIFFTLFTPKRNSRHYRARPYLMR